MAAEHHTEKVDKIHEKTHSNDKISHGAHQDAAHSALTSEAWAKPGHAATHKAEAIKPAHSDHAATHKVEATKPAHSDHAATHKVEATKPAHSDHGATHKIDVSKSDHSGHAETPAKPETHKGELHPKAKAEQTLSIPPLEKTQASAGKERFIPSKVDKEELLFFSDAFQGMKKADAVKDIQDINNVINQQGRPIAEAMKDLIQANRVIALGEAHTFHEENSERNWAIKEMKTFKALGITHIGIEVASDLQPIFAAFNKTKPGTPLTLPGSMEDPVADQALRNLNIIAVTSPELIQLWMVARDNGIKLVAMDNAHNFADEKDQKRLDASREKDMAQNVMNVIKENSDNKMLVWVGNQHLANSKGHYGHKMFAEELSHSLEKRGKGESLATVYAATTNTEMEDFSPMPFAQRVKEPVVVPTKTGEKANDLGGLPMFANPEIDPKVLFPMAVYDHVVFFPKGKKSR